MIITRKLGRSLLATPFFSSGRGGGLKPHQPTSLHPAWFNCVSSLNSCDEYGETSGRYTAGAGLTVCRFPDVFLPREGGLGPLWCWSSTVSTVRALLLRMQKGTARSGRRDRSVEGAPNF